MRELQAIQSIIDKVLLRGRESNAKRIKNLYLVLGEISELNQKSIQDHWSSLSKGTPAEGAKLHFRVMAAELQCMSCLNKYHPIDEKIHCPNCGSFGAKILSGEEFYVESIELDPE